MWQYLQNTVSGSHRKDHAYEDDVPLPTDLEPYFRSTNTGGCITVVHFSQIRVIQA